MSHYYTEAVSAVDGRYRNKTEHLSPYLSESALMKYRVAVEARWLLFLSRELISHNLPVSKAETQVLEKFSDVAALSSADVERIKTIEATTNHDVKACEYFLRERLQQKEAAATTLAFLHFACTSEDINNSAYAMMLRDAFERVLIPEATRVTERLKELAYTWIDVPLLARTHGQTASPTTMGKELAVFYHRLNKVLADLKALHFEAKFNGAVGNYNAHKFALPDENWPEISRRFVESELGLCFNPLTTQIENHDSISKALDTSRRFNVILIGLCRDMWTYISQGYFTQKVISGEVGSSTMPHKVNPIDFENAEGNFGVANSLANHLSEKLLISRLQRDLSDSTVMRTLGTVMGHTSIALAALLKGLGKVELNVENLQADLANAWEVLAEPVQTVLRLNGVVDAYERLKTATRGKSFSAKSYKQLVNELADLRDEQRMRLIKLTPADYTGLAGDLARSVLNTDN